MLIESNSLVWSSLAPRPFAHHASDPRRWASLEAWILEHVRERALFLPERRVVASFLVRVSRGRGRDVPPTNEDRLRCARQVTWDLLCAQDTAEKHCAPFDGIEIEFYRSFGERLGIDTFSARCAALSLNGQPLELRRTVREILFGSTRPLPGPSPEGQRTAAAYRAIRVARGVESERARELPRPDRIAPADVSPEEPGQASRARAHGGTLGDERASSA